MSAAVRKGACVPPVPVEARPPGVAEALEADDVRHDARRLRIVDILKLALVAGGRDERKLAVGLPGARELPHARWAATLGHAQVFWVLPEGRDPATSSLAALGCHDGTNAEVHELVAVARPPRVACP